MTRLTLERRVTAIEDELSEIEMVLRTGHRCQAPACYGTTTRYASHCATHELKLPVWLREELVYLMRQRAREPEDEPLRLRQVKALGQADVVLRATR